MNAKESFRMQLQPTTKLRVSSCLCRWSSLFAMDRIKGLAGKVALTGIKPKQNEAISALVTGSDVFISLRQRCRVSQREFFAP